MTLSLYSLGSTSRPPIFSCVSLKMPFHLLSFTFSFPPSSTANFPPVSLPVFSVRLSVKKNVASTSPSTVSFPFTAAEFSLSVGLDRSPTRFAIISSVGLPFPSPSGDQSRGTVLTKPNSSLSTTSPDVPCSYFSSSSRNGLAFDLADRFGWANTGA